MHIFVECPEVSSIWVSNADRELMIPLWIYIIIWYLPCSLNNSLLIFINCPCIKGDLFSCLIYRLSILSLVYLNGLLSDCCCCCLCWLVRICNCCYAFCWFLIMRWNGWVSFRSTSLWRHSISIITYYKKIHKDCIHQLYQLCVITFEFQYTHISLRRTNTTGW